MTETGRKYSAAVTEALLRYKRNKAAGVAVDDKEETRRRRKISRTARQDGETAQDFVVKHLDILGEMEYELGTDTLIHKWLWDEEWDGLEDFLRLYLSL